MKNGLAIWHYPHRTLAENVHFFAAAGFDSLSFNGNRFVAALRRGEGEEIAAAVGENSFVLTVHYCLPRSHDSKDVNAFYEGMELISAWQRQYNYISILSFDVLGGIRDHAGEYIDYALAHIEGCRVAVEDFGLTEQESRQIEHLKGNDRFGYLIDIGHMFIRLGGRNHSGKALFTTSMAEGVADNVPDLSAFKKAFASKEFPIFEIHLHNNDGIHDTHLFLEDGALDVEMIAGLLWEIGFDGVLTIESAPGFEFECYGDEADKGILQTYEYWKACLDKRIQGC